VIRIFKRNKKWEIYCYIFKGKRSQKYKKQIDPEYSVGYLIINSDEE